MSDDCFSIQIEKCLVIRFCAIILFCTKIQINYTILILHNLKDVNIWVRRICFLAGVCADDITQISAGQYDKCNQSFDYGVVCSAEQPQNISW